MNRLAGITIILLVSVLIVACNSNSISQATMDHGKQVYGKTCLGCHMESAKGVPGLNPPLINSELLLKDKSTPIRIVLRGSEELKKLPKREYKNVMASLSNLSDEEIADVLTYVRNSYGNKAPAISADEVKTQRDKLK